MGQEHPSTKFNSRAVSCLRNGVVNMQEGRYITLYEVDTFGDFLLSVVNQVFKDHLFHSWPSVPNIFHVDLPVG